MDKKYRLQIPRIWPFTIWHLSLSTNCSKSFTNNGGEHISICYMNALWGVADRQQDVARTKFHEYTCKHCADSTEFGTMFNVLKCKNGSRYHRTAPRILRMKKDDVHTCLKFINRYKEVLHENHFYNINVKKALADIIFLKSEEIETVGNDLRKKITLCKKLDKLLRILVPAETKIRGCILFELHATLVEYGRRQGMPHLIAVFVESVNCLTNAYLLLHREPEILPEGMIALRAQECLQEVKNDILKLIIYISIEKWCRIKLNL
ncbi:hypothetical protein KM043_014377 [Ampulex compressa]|nr:hypothetical protein KM043_014377 [Ampulex compressa]